MNEKPWTELVVTKEDVEELWEKFNAIKEVAQQHDFVSLLMIDSRYIPLYNDLTEHWDDYHAQMFVYGLTKAIENAGFSL
jgi:hypothetical protein